MICLSIHFKNADVSVRQQFAFSPEIRTAFLHEFCQEPCTQAVLLCTCNRTELYYAGDISAEQASACLARYAGLTAPDIAPFLRIYPDTRAVRHLFRVSCGIDSMVVGEDEILRQVKEAYRESAQEGVAGFEIHTVFQSAIACAKRIKTDTALSRTPVSVATLAANEASRMGEHVQVLLIGGSGKIGSAVAKNLAAHDNVRVTMTIRAHNVPFSLPDTVTPVPYAQRMDYADTADCIISATSSPHYTVTAKALAAALHTEKTRLLIDLAVPPDIERAAASLTGVRLIGIDDFDRIAEENRLHKQDMVTQAEAIIAEEQEVCQKKLIFHTLQPCMDTVRSKLQSMTPDLLLYRLREELDSEQFAAVTNVLRKMGEED